MTGGACPTSPRRGIRVEAAFFLVSVGDFVGAHDLDGAEVYPWIDGVDDLESFVLRSGAQDGFVQVALG